MENKENIKQKLCVVVMGENCEKFISMCLESCKDADAIVYCDGGSIDNTFNILKRYNIFETDGIIRDKEDKLKDITFKFEDKIIIRNNYNQEDKQMNGKQRNFYLNYLKQNYPNDWALVCDADEVVEDLSKVKEFIQTSPEGLYSVKMRHFIGDLGHEDATQQTHYALNRLFKISEADSYPLTEHPVLKSKTNKYYQADITNIWHLAYTQGIFDIKKKYDNHLKKSEMHTPQYLEEWRDAHLLGKYPTKPVDILEIPEIILKSFGISKDKYYFANRGIELKNALMVKQWNDYFKPKDVLDLGCGRGPYLYFWKWFVKICNGLEISQYAIDHAFTSGISKGDITDMTTRGHDLITCIDVLEHLDNKELNKALETLAEAGERFLFSIPFKGSNGQPDDPNLIADKTHKQFQTKEEWKKLIESYGIEINDAPKEWLYSNQLLIGKKKEFK